MEKWKEIIGAPNYFISNLGRVKGIRGHCMKLAISKKGYPVCRIPNRNYSKPVSRVVAIHFIPNPKKLPQVNHKDGNKLNNIVKNLEWNTCKQNINHAIKTGLRSKNINLKNNSMFDNIQVVVIKSALKNGFSGRSIAKYFRCDDSTISKINVGSNYHNVI